MSVNSSDLHSKKCHRLAASCGFHRLATRCQQVAASLLTSSSCIKCENQTCCNKIFSDFLQVVETEEAGLLQRARFWPCNSTLDVASMAIKSEA